MVLEEFKLYIVMLLLSKVCCFINSLDRLAVWHA